MPAKRTKTDTVTKMLARPTGASIAQLEKATGWQPHSVRAALTRLRQAGLAVERHAEQGSKSIYRIANES